MFYNRTLVLLSLLSLCACSTDLSRGVYEGVRQRNESLRSGSPDSASSRAPGYEDYERERRELARPPAGRN